MITVGMLVGHSSSPTKAYEDLVALAKREDMYTGDDFYFGFASSNHTFLDIIGGHQPLAIKYGPIFSMFRHDSKRACTCEIYYIDAHARMLHPMLKMAAKPSGMMVFNRLLPWSFTDVYSYGLELEAKPLSVEEDDPEKIRSVIEQIANGLWPDDDTLRLLPETVNHVVFHEDGLTMSVEDVFTLKKRMQTECSVPTVDDFVAAYHPFHDNTRFNIDFMLEKNPKRITVRHINDETPRIQVIIPGVPEDVRYIAIFKEEQPELYNRFKTSLNVPLSLQDLLVEHYSEKVALYFEGQGITFSEEAVHKTKMGQ